MTTDYYIAKAHCRKAERLERARVAHLIRRKIKRIARKTYGIVCLAGMALLAPIAIWEAGKVIEWAVVFIKGLIELI